MQNRLVRTVPCGSDTGDVSIPWVLRSLRKRNSRKSGLPLLILDGDGCDRSHGGEGQTSTRLGAFLEMLGGAENE